MTVTVRASDGSGNPSTSVLYTLTKPTTVGTGLQQFYAPDGARLQANTNYFVHVSYGDSGTTPRLRTTASNSEDSGAYSGWSIANDRREYENGSWSSPSNTIKIKVMAPNVPLPAPAAPTDLSAELDDGEVTLTWTDPDDPSIFKYQYSTNGGTSFSDISGSGATTAAYTVTGLTNGTEYTLAVRGVNATDYGSASTVAATPEIVYVSNMDQATNTSTGTYSGTRRYAQRFTTGGGPLGFYLGSIELDFQQAPGNGTLKVTVRTGNGSGYPSGTALYTLTNPANVGTGLNQFEAPTGAYLNKNSNYVVVLKDTGGGTLPRLERTSSGAEDAGAYSGWSIQNNHRSASGSGSWVYEYLAVQIKVKGPDVIPPPPAAPTNLTATPGGQSVTVTWDHPGNISIRKYQYSTDGGSTFNHMNGSNKDTTSFTFSNLTNGTEYNLAVRASNLSGASTAATVTAMPLWALPADLVAGPDDGRLVLGWSDPDDSTITGYQLSTDGGTNFTDIPGSDANTTRHAVTGLTNGTEYTFAVRVANAPHYAVAGTVTATPAVVVPAAPTGLSSSPGDGQLTLSWDDPGNVTIETYQLMRLAAESKLAASDGADHEEFGHSVAIDGNTAVVGAREEGDGSGAAYIFTKDTGSDSWTQQAKLTASDVAPGSSPRFGQSVAIDGDTVLVGAFLDNNGNGSVFVFVKPALGWTDATETQKLTESGAAGGARFGNALAIDGDTAVIGAHDDSHSGINKAGAAYVFTKDASGVWNQAADLTASDPSVGDKFGESVAVDGDTVVVGAPENQPIGSVDETGSAYIFIKPAGGWTDATETALLTAFDGEDGDRFGYSVAIDGDTVVVGAYLEDDNGTSSGSAYVFTEPNSGWADATETAKLTASDGTDSDYFGFSVAVDGDTVVVGAPGDSNRAGSVYLFTKPATGWDDVNEVTKITASDGGQYHQFGFSVAVDSDTVIAGGNGGTGNESGSGAVYIWDPVDTGWTDISGSGYTTTSHTVTGLTNGVHYTAAIRAGNLSGNGEATTVAGTPSS